MQNLDSDHSISRQQAQRFLNRIDNERLIQLKLVGLQRVRSDTS